MQADELITFYYRGEQGQERAPQYTKRLIVDASVKRLPDFFCRRTNTFFLEDIQLNEGLRQIGHDAFETCLFSKVTIPSTTTIIGARAFNGVRVKHISFTEPSSLQRIRSAAFIYCRNLGRITTPSSLTVLEESVFSFCASLVEVDLSLSHMINIPNSAFTGSRKLRAVRLPNSVQLIATFAFSNCPNLVTVEVAPTSSRITLGENSFQGCVALANIGLPKRGCSHSGEPFEGCTSLKKHYGATSREIIKGILRRFDRRPVHKLCYYSSTTTVQDLLLDSTESHHDSKMIDKFKMTPFHILCLSVKPRRDLFLALLDNTMNKYPHYVLGRKDAKRRRAMDYLLSNWTPEAADLFQIAMQRWAIDPLQRWGAPDELVQDMEACVEAIVSGSNGTTTSKRRFKLYKAATSAFKFYASHENMTVLELSLWKQKLQEMIGAAPQERREDCRVLCQADLVLANVSTFLGLVQS